MFNVHSTSQRLQRLTGADSPQIVSLFFSFLLILLSAGPSVSRVRMQQRLGDMRTSARA